MILGEDERIPYGETLLSIITGKNRLSDIACTATTMNGSGKSIKERIKFIAEKPKVLGATVVAVLILIMIVSVFVFTKQPLYSGYTWEGEMTLTAGDMQVRLPETIAGISSYDTERDGNDIIIYQLASGKETGRFSELSYEAAVGLVDEGREIIPVGNYGLNDYLKSYIKSGYSYMPTESTTHIYRPKEEEATEWGDNNPMLSSDWEVVPLEEETDYLPNEQITVMDIVPNSDSVTIHDYTSAAEQTQGVIAHEESRDYLPNKQIITTGTAEEISSEKCYVYVKADYSDVQEKYLDEMEYINSELETAAGRVIVISINQEIRSEMFAALAKNRTEYLGDASKTGAIVNALPQADGLAYKHITLHTLQTEPETALSLEVRYELTAQDMSDVDRDILLFNAVMIFATIKNLEECNFVIEDNVSGTHYKADYLDDNEGIELFEQYKTLTYSRTDLEEVIGALWSDEAADSDEDYVRWLEDLYARIADYLQ